MTDDLISRADAINAIATHFDNYGGIRKYATHLIERIPSAQPKQGEWIENDKLDGGYWHCSACKTPTEAFAAFKIYPFCPFCGARMNSSEKPNNCEMSESTDCAWK